MFPTPPKWALRFLSLTCAEPFRDELEGDLLELFDRDIQQFGLKKARRKFAWKAIGSVRWYRLRGLRDISFFMMWNNHFKMAYRHALKHKVVAAINFVGLLLGIAAAGYIGLYLKNELAYDQMHLKQDRLYRVLRTNQAQGGLTMVTSSRYGKTLGEAFPFIRTCSFGNDPVRIGEEHPLLVDDFHWADSTFFELFSFPLIEGNPATCLDAVNSLVITESLSRQLFGTTAALGKTIKVKVYDGDQELQMQVTGVAVDPPKHTHIQFKALGAMANAEKLYESLIPQWGFSWLRTYVEIQPDRMATVERRLPEVLKRAMGMQYTEDMEVAFQPLREVYLQSQHLHRNTQKGDLRILYIIAVIGMLIILISLSNYINLATARTVTRTKEVGVRKVLGTTNGHIFSQFVIESIFFTVMAGLVAVGLIYWGLPAVNQFFGFDLFWSVLSWSDLFWGILVLIGLGFLAGSLPAITMTKIAALGDSRARIQFQPQSTNWARKLFIGTQYLITLLLLVAAMVVFQQYRYMKNYDLGFNAAQVLHIPVDDRVLQSKISLMKEQFRSVNGVLDITMTGEDLPSEMNNTWDIAWTGMESSTPRSIGIVGVDQHYFSLMNIPFISGHNFKHNYSVDSARSVVVNQTAQEEFGWEEPVGKKVMINGRTRTVIGVVRDHHNTSLHTQPVPMGFLVFPPGYRVSPDNLLLKVETADLPALLRNLESRWSSFSPDPFEYNFVDEAFAQAYQQEQQFSRLVTTFTLMAILISLIGIFGLISFTTEMKLKEISIRRVLGATEWSLFHLLGKEFFFILMGALFLGGPAAFYLMQSWLENYVYRISMSGGYILLAGTICLMISILVVRYHLRKTSRIAPGEVLSGE